MLIFYWDFLGSELVILFSFKKISTFQLYEMPFPLWLQVMNVNIGSHTTSYYYDSQILSIVNFD